MMLTQKGIVERGASAHMNIIDHISGMREYEALEYIHSCIARAGRAGRHETTNASMSEESNLLHLEQSTLSTDQREEVVRTSSEDEGLRYTRRGRSKASLRLEELEYLSVHDLCLPAQEMALLKRRATLNNCDLGQYLTHILLYNLKFRRGKGSKLLPQAEKVRIMNRNKGCATVKTEKEKKKGNEG